MSVLLFWTLSQSHTSSGCILSRRLRGTCWLIRKTVMTHTKLHNYCRPVLHLKVFFKAAFSNTLDMDICNSILQLKVICPGMDGVLLKVTHTKLHPQSSWHVFHSQGYVSDIRWQSHVEFCPHAFAPSRRDISVRWASLWVIRSCTTNTYLGRLSIIF